MDTAGAPVTFADLGIDPVVVALAVALSSRTPVEVFAGEARVAGWGSHQPAASATPKTPAFARSRPANRKG